MLSVAAAPAHVSIGDLNGDGLDDFAVVEERVNAVLGPFRTITMASQVLLLKLSSGLPIHVEARPAVLSPPPFAAGDVRGVGRSDL